MGDFADDGEAYFLLHGHEEFQVEVPTVPERRTVYAVHQAEEASEAHRLASAADRVLAALQSGPKTNLQLIHICQRISGRVYDLRQRGYDIRIERIDPGVYRYSLRQESTHA